MAKKKGIASKHKKRGGEEKMEKGQIWSVDVIIGIVIFITILIIFYTTLTDNTSDFSEELKKNADTVVLKLTQDVELKVLDENNKINYSKLEIIANMSYDELKKKLGIQGDFCMYIEDENGRLVPIGDKSSIGSSEINVSGDPCGAII